MQHDDTRRCALPGCVVEIHDVPGRPPRRYCTAAHRAAARQARRTSAQAAQDHQRLAETLPWLREPAEEPPAAAVPPARGSERVTARAVPDPAPHHDRSWAFPARATRPAHDARPIRPASPARPVRAAAAARAERGPRRSPSLPRSRRLLAVLGAAGILAGGYAVTSSEPQRVQASGPLQAAPTAWTEDEWAARATVTLASLDRQLDTIAQTEVQWSRLVAGRHISSPPSSVRQLLERKSLLERRKTILQAQIANYRSLDRARSDLERAEQHLRALERALASAPPESRRTPEQAAEIAALIDQRDLGLRQRDAKRAELESLRKNVATAASTPLPDDGQKTAQVSSDVMEVIETGGRDGGKPGDDRSGQLPERPDLVGNREQQLAQERQDTANSAPPDPRGPRDESAEREEKRKRGNGPVGAVVGGVGDVLTGGESDDSGPGASNDRPGKADDDGDRDKPAGGLVGRVGDTLGVGGGGEDDRAGRAEPRERAEAAPAPRVQAPVGGGELRLIPEPRREAAPPPPAAAPQAAPPQSAAPRSAAPRPVAPRSAAPQPAAPPAQAAPADVPGAGMARAVMGSVPGGQFGEAALESGLREAAARQAAEQRSAAPAPAPRQRQVPVERADTSADRVSEGSRTESPQAQDAQSQGSRSGGASSDGSRSGSASSDGSSSDGPSSGSAQPDSSPSESSSQDSGSSGESSSGGGGVERTLEYASSTASDSGSES